MNKMPKIDIKTIILLLIITVGVMYHITQVNEIKATYDAKILTLTTQNTKAQEDSITYKVMYQALDSQIKDYKAERDNAVQKYNYLSEQIKYSKLNEKKNASRGDFSTKNLKDYPVITIDEMNAFIKSVAPADSPFIGRGEDFLKASFINGIDPRYIFAHACVESKYGKSNLALTKGNYFGINAVNDNPNKAYDMGDSLDRGIENGASWIANNYINKGYNTLDKMAYGGYAQYDDGSPNTDWINQISNIASRFKN